MVARDLARNFVVMFTGNVIGQLFFFFALARLARVLGPSEFGMWNFAQVFMLYLFRASEFGLETVGIRETSRDPGLIRSWIAIVVSSRFVLGSFFFGFALIVSTADLLPSGTTPLVLISALAVFPMAFVLEWVFEARQEVGLISVARILKGLLFFIAVVLVVSTSEDAELAAWLYIGSLALSVLIVAVVVLGRFGFDWSSLTLRSSLVALKKTGSIGTASMLSQYSLFASTMVVGYFLSNEELGYFTAANRIVIFLWAYVILNMHRILLPNLSRAFHESLSDYKRFVVKIFRLSALAAVPIGLVGTLCATETMSILYSARYEASGAVFGILLWGFVLATIRSILEIGLIASEGQRRYMKGMVFLSVMYTVLTPILALQLGIVGAAVAVVVAELSYFVYLVSTSPYAEPSSLLRNSWKPLGAAIITIVSLLPFAGLHPVLRVGLGSMVFGVVVVALKGVTINDFQVIKSLFRSNSLEPTT